MVYAMFNNLVSMTEPVYTYVEEFDSNSSEFPLFSVSEIIVVNLVLILLLTGHDFEFSILKDKPTFLCS